MLSLINYINVEFDTTLHYTSVLCLFMTDVIDDHQWYVSRIDPPSR